MNPTNRFFLPTLLLALLLLLAACAPANASIPTSAPTQEPTPTDAPPTAQATVEAAAPVETSGEPPAPVAEPTAKPTVEPTVAPTQEVDPTPETSPTPEATATPSSPEAVARKNANLRGGPGTNYDKVGGVTTGESYEVVGMVDQGRYNWYKLENGGWIRGDLVDVSNPEQIPTIPNSEIPPVPTPAPAPTKAPTPEQPAPPNPEVNDGRYVWGGWPGEGPMRIGPVDLLHRQGIDDSLWTQGPKFQSVSYVTRVDENDPEGRHFWDAGKVFLTGKVMSAHVTSGGYLHVTIRCQDGSIEEDITIVPPSAGIIVFTRSANDGAPSFYLTDIKQVGPELFPVDSYVGVSITKGTDGPNYQLDYDAVLISD